MTERREFSAIVSINGDGDGAHVEWNVVSLGMQDSIGKAARQAHQYLPDVPIDIICRSDLAERVCELLARDDEVALKVNATDRSAATPLAHRRARR